MAERLFGERDQQTSFLDPCRQDVIQSLSDPRTVVTARFAVADAMSDALGIHVAEESKNSGQAGEIWESTLATFAAKLVIAGTFAVPVLFMPLDVAIAASLAWGLSLLAMLSYALARAQQVAPWKVIGEHVVIGLCVVTMTHYLGEWVRATFG